MYLKCQYCDVLRLKKLKEDGKHLDNNGNRIVLKSINIETDSYVKTKKGYYHEECLRKELLNKGKLTEEEIENTINELKLKQQQEQRNKLYEAKFFEWIKEHYKTTIPAYYAMRIKKITSGTDEMVYGSIGYDELLEMYEMMQNYLAKCVKGKVFKNTAQQMNYELAIVLGHYENYKNYKNKMAEKNNEVVKIKEKIEESQKFNSAAERVRRNNDDFRISDYIDEFF